MTTKTKTTNADDTILATLKAGPKGLAELMEAVGKGETATRKLVNALLDRGAITKRTENRAVCYELAKKGSAKTPHTPKPHSTRDELTARDEQALAILKEAGFKGLSKYELAEKLGCSPSLAYLAFYRLRKQGLTTILPTGSRRPVYATQEAVDSGKF